MNRDDLVAGKRYHVTLELAIDDDGDFWVGPFLRAESFIHCDSEGIVEIKPIPRRLPTAAGSVISVITEAVGKVKYALDIDDNWIIITGHYVGVKADAESLFSTSNWTLEYDAGNDD